MKKIAISQSNYIPWKGYFDMINMVDEFVLFDDVQYTTKNWRNRNCIKTKNGVIWLTIPVMIKGNQKNPIKTIKISNEFWRKKHWKTIKLNYQKTKYFDAYKDIFEQLYLNDNEILLSKINYNFIISINKILGIETKISFSSDYNYSHKTGDIDSIIELIKSTKSNLFYNGPTAKQYMTKEMFSKHDIILKWIDYSDYIEYTQQYPPFEHGVSILDLIFNEGENAIKYMKSFK